MGQKDRKFEELMNRVKKLEATHNKGSTQRSENGTTNIRNIEQSNGERRRRNNDLQNIQCFGCRNFGHYVRDCPQRDGNIPNLLNPNVPDFYPQWPGVKASNYTVPPVAPAVEVRAPVNPVPSNYCGPVETATVMEIEEPRCDDTCLQERQQATEIVRRQVPKCDGIYVKGKIQGIDVTFIADTGATQTIVSRRIYEKIPAECRPQLKKTSSLTGAGGDPMVELGKAVFDIQLESLCLKREVVVAEIEDQALLGIDVLQNGPDGPADILLTKGIIQLNGVEIPVEQIGLPGQLRKVREAENFVIPGGVSNKKCKKKKMYRRRYSDLTSATNNKIQRDQRGTRDMKHCDRRKKNERVRGPPWHPPLRNKGYRQARDGGPPWLTPLRKEGYKPPWIPPPRMDGNAQLGERGPPWLTPLWNG